jgi:hypothetical protein
MKYLDEIEVLFKTALDIKSRDQVGSFHLISRDYPFPETYKGPHWRLACQLYSNFQINSMGHALTGAGEFVILPLLHEIPVRFAVE